MLETKIKSMIKNEIFTKADLEYHSDRDDAKMILTSSPIDSPNVCEGKILLCYL